ncbi:MAG: polyphenol oxidase family protein [Candidatus Actinomarina sp.]
MICSSLIQNAYFSSIHDGDIKKILKEIKSEVNFAEMKQTHSSKVKFINNEGTYDSDGIETNTQNLPLVVRVADCMPILMKSKNLISVVHAGWRGINSSIFEKSLKNHDFSSLKISIGPHARECCYEVKEDLKQLFPLSTIEIKGKYFLNLRKRIEDFCNNENIAIEIFKECTICDKNYFSYRETSTFKRQFGIIWQ